MARAIVEATTHYQDPAVVARVSKGLGTPMRGLSVTDMADGQRLATRGW
jgi:pyridoxal 5'-phosphate synthase pdxS subunit